MNACLIGVGSIGGDKHNDVDNKKTAVKTHAHALYNNREYFDNIYIVDKNIEPLTRVCDKWDFKESFVDLDFLLKESEHIDFFVIATPQETHLELFKKIAPHKPKSVLIEKPCGNSQDECNDIGWIAAKFNIKVFVDYQRNFIYGLPLLDGLDKVKKIVLNYTRGFIRDGSHFFALLAKEQLEMPYDIKLLSAVNDLDDIKDLTYTLFFKITGKQGEKVEVFMNGFDGRIADVFEIMFYGDKENVSLVDHGKLRLNAAHEEEKTFGKGYKSFSNTTLATMTDLENGLECVHDDITLFLNTSSSLFYQGSYKHALEAWTMMEQIKGVING